MFELVQNQFSKSIEIYILVMLGYKDNQLYYTFEIIDWIYTELNYLPIVKTLAFFRSHACVTVLRLGW